MNKKNIKQTIGQKVASLLFLVGAIIGVFGQEEIPINYTIDMFPKTPDDAAISKFIDIPPGSYTGVADFSIPIFTIPFDGEDVPIELRYSTAGVKVAEIASRVGLGWAFNMGPSLTQQVMGNRDKSFSKPVLSDTFEIPDVYCFMLQPNNDNPCAILLGATGLNWPNADLKHDIFSYSLINESGKFIMDSGGEFGVPRPYNDNLKMEPLFGGGYINGMRITDSGGYIYNFDGIGANGFVSNFNSCYYDAFT